MASLLYVAIRLSTKVVILVLYVADIVFNFWSRSDVLNVCFVHQIMLSCLRKVLLSNHSAVRLRLLHIDWINTLTNSLEHWLVRLFHVHATIRVFVHSCLHLSVHYVLVLLTVCGWWSCGVWFQIIIEARWGIGILFIIGTMQIQIVALIILVCSIWLIIANSSLSRRAFIIFSIDYLIFVLE